MPITLKPQRISLGMARILIKRISGEIKELRESAIRNNVWFESDETPVNTRSHFDDSIALQSVLVDLKTESQKATAPILESLNCLAEWKGTLGWMEDISKEWGREVTKREYANGQIVSFTVNQKVAVNGDELKASIALLKKQIDSTQDEISHFNNTQTITVSLPWSGESEG